MKRAAKSKAKTRAASGKPAKASGTVREPPPDFAYNYQHYVFGRPRREPEWKVTLPAAVLNRVITQADADKFNARMERIAETLDGKLPADFASRLDDYLHGPLGT